MSCESRKKCFYFEVSKKIVVLIEVCVYPDIQCNKKPRQYKWFGGIHFLKLLEKLKDVCLARVLADNSFSKPGVQDVKEVISGPSYYFHMRYTFKKKRVKQFVVMKNTQKKIYKPLDDGIYSGGDHQEFDLFPERLQVFVSLAPLKFGTVIKERISVNKGIPGSKIAKQEMKATIKEKSEYFAKDKDVALTLSAVKKQANLRSIIQRMNDSCTDIQKDLNRNANHEEQKLAMPFCTVNNIHNSDDKEMDSRCSSTVNDMECKHKRSRLDDGLNDNIYTDSDTGRDEPQGDDACDQSDFVIKKCLRRKKRIRNADKQIIENNSTDLPKGERRINHVQTVYTSTLSEVGNNCADTAKETNSSGSEDAGNLKRVNTSVFVDLSKNEKSLNMKENEQDIVEDKIEEPRQLHESITIDDTAPSFNNVKKISDLGNKHIDFLVHKLEKKLKAIFMGKEYCRRHEDYKRGGRSKGDLAFQVRFGLYSEEQQEAIMKELMSIFCSRHNKYIDYLTKVLLPETFIHIYMELFGGNHDEVEHILMGNVSNTDGSSTE